MSNSDTTQITVPPKGEVRISDHAVEQYRVRVRDLEPDQARRELERLRDDVAEFHTEAPLWARDAQIRDLYLVVGDALVLPLAHDHRGRWAATTCLTPGSLTSRQKRGRAHARKTRKGGR
jgi:hypothetical protein